ncbi:MAG: hypothetical protein LBB43_06220 [Spirochaetaceae bacterium]|jgi:flagellar biosynthesis component FlhA|nr:hypothetical protein [Spirochaetaceae bacterium]
MDWSSSLIVLAMLVGVPAIIMFSVYKIVKLLAENARIKHQEKLSELEIEKQKNQVKLLEEENKKYDNIINNS